ncbi:MAG TPA: aspartate carbamoyltransferase regulatory subunit [Nitrososphaerales archaeon]|jgi:aspartate carbamoyltransferase regulatory subunit|nr:aspartate carbamoyltransferase regulatory subunit [Nitrososphaerales archaeon]NSL74224.1 aspartate carbamoyltransferase regulatory subunit [Nitrososphaerota archaeon]NSL74501.1 aspartate carbamoyltransferase regulatory subunit [Nitrososphaerota archaeon]NSL75822.1 aspartate carbamoyltransferase regulatory subunit [Nitrososphaerota archaeon]NSL76868.1 aspartate carbamoyltransferase regulatory subunit [Nitrososphaerota archaeon]|tara:strand:- start:373 stop:834 length:462 start_codon:yes stop_codon:yes gene_type:complete
MTETYDLRISRIKHGTVLDHIIAGRAFNVLSALDINGTDGNQVSVAMNVSSKQYSKKDIIKIENRILAVEETNRLALITPNSTINIIENYEITEKRNVELPKKFTGVFKCTNPTCISNSSEPIISELLIINNDPPRLKCKYCTRISLTEEILK